MSQNPERPIPEESVVWADEEEDEKVGTVGTVDFNGSCIQ